MDCCKAFQQGKLSPRRFSNARSSHCRPVLNKCSSRCISAAANSVTSTFRYLKHISVLVVAYQLHLRQHLGWSERFAVRVLSSSPLSLIAGKRFYTQHAQLSQVWLLPYMHPMEGLSLTACLFQKETVMYLKYGKLTALRVEKNPIQARNRTKVCKQIQNLWTWDIDSQHLKCIGKIYATAC